MFDRHGTASLVISTLVAAPFAIFVFLGSSVAMAVVGVVLWGIGMGAQESILKAAVTAMVPKQSRATGYGIFECCFGIAWFLGSWLLGVLYDQSLGAMVVVSVMAQLLAVPFFFRQVKK
jgi:predicted MFS family arabinose efflux permease